MKRINNIAIAAALLLLSTAASAQSFRSGYFLDNYVYGYRINPAQINRKSFFAVGLGNFDLQNNSSFGVASMLFPTENGVVTGFNKAVSADTFLGGIPDGARVSLNENINILSVGTAKKKSMHTFEINVRALGSVALPYDLFAFLKLGGDKPYDISGINVSASAIGDVSYGFSRKIGNFMNIGARFHFLVGVADASIYTANSSITMGSSETELKSEIRLQTSGLPSISTDQDGHLDFNSLALKGPYIGGFGGGLDLGVELHPLKGMDIMASVTEFGVISRNNTTNLKADTVVKYSGGDIKYEDGTVEADFKAVLDELTKAIVFQDGEAGRRMDVLPFNAQLGLRYKLPFAKAISFGALGTYHSDKVVPWYEVRGGMTLSAGYFLSLSGNVGYGTFGPTAGGALNIQLGPFNLLAGAETFLEKELGKINGIPVPLHSFPLNAHVGLTMTFGGPAHAEKVAERAAAKAAAKAEKQ